MRCPARLWRLCVKCWLGACPLWQKVCIRQPTTMGGPSRRVITRTDLRSGGSLCIKVASAAFGPSSGVIGNGRQSHCTTTSSTIRDFVAICAGRIGKSSGSGSHSFGGTRTCGGHSCPGVYFGIGITIGLNDLTCLVLSALMFGFDG